MYTSDGSVESDESLDYSNSESEEEQVNHEEETQCKHLVVVETPNSISSLENSEARQKEVEEEHRLLKKRNASMEKVINSNSGYFVKKKGAVSMTSLLKTN